MIHLIYHVCFYIALHLEFSMNAPNKRCPVVQHKAEISSLALCLAVATGAC